MKIFNKLFILGVVLAASMGCSPSKAPTLDTALIEQAQITNLTATDAASFTAGQPTEAQFQTLAEAGVKHIVNLRTAGELDWDEQAHVQSLGMEYHHIPVAGATGVNSDNARKLQQLLSGLDGEPVLVHCGSGNRVGALVALAEGETNGSDIEAAIAEGKRWGLTRLEPVVREKLSQ
ncbi:hypothetical protein FKG94_12200 [Exilibacterium tricleocarpae]|uniref:DSP-PTPase phosphatase fused to NAD+ Kinase domain-containing protein n=1 Tax=Exilibacterium tricleocarpae TaxID=2591008 RepID=A0A545TNJ4_9GAMM|nr:protein tyrosine phosphatase family protein [Exilibacterium tricleocarpae]TQV78776.1 hypothetical protein FKG94_12200 [Exilibacterium tricleocarpae]